MTKEKVKMVLTKLYGPDVRFTKTVSGRESASVPLSPQERAIAAGQMSVGRHTPDGRWVEDAEEKERRLDEVRHIVAAKNILTGEWEFAGDVSGMIERVTLAAITGEI